MIKANCNVDGVKEAILSVKNSTEELTSAVTKGFAGDGIVNKGIGSISAFSSQAQITFKQKKSKI